ncbi:hypothetical protein [Nonomuraea fuscirosea]|uniref:hypothetical protein n=1 Tax=Nonomuraea fuscirosea TaxID=1291556 RepID=UPI003401F756
MYFYDEGWFLMQRGMAELELGDGRRAADYLERGLSTLPEHYRRDRAWYRACLARAQALRGGAEAAVATALNVAPDATALNAYAVAELQRIAHDLAITGAPGSEAIKESLAARKP